jgi:tartrate dehydrogenase/decarboxylase / D-malate dehydrogenase
MSERAQTAKIAKIPADGVGREVVEAGQRVLDSVAERLLLTAYVGTGRCTAD